MSEARDLREALGLGAGQGLIAIVGGGGKTTLMFRLARELPGRVVATTTTRIFAAQMELAERVCTLSEGRLEDELDGFRSSLLVVGERVGERAVGVPQALPAEILAHPRVDWVVVEADGSRMRPVKAPAEHEPVVPPETDTLVVVAGIDALAEPIERVAHRPERVCAITGLEPTKRLTPEKLAQLLASEAGGLKGRPLGARAVLLLNKVESPSQQRAAANAAEHVLAEGGFDRVLSGALQATAIGWTVWRDAGLASQG